MPTLAKVAIFVAVLVGTSACVLASEGVCAGLVFHVVGLELSGGSIAIGLIAGAAKGAADYALDTGRHTLAGYLWKAGTSAIEDAAVSGLPEESLFGKWARGAHSTDLGYFDALKDLPRYLSSLAKSGLHSLGG